MRCGVSDELMRPLMPADVLGLRSACVPAGLGDGLPVGVLLAADRFRDGPTLAAAEVVEAALGPTTPIATWPPDQPLGLDRRATNQGRGPQ